MSVIEKDKITAFIGRRSDEEISLLFHKVKMTLYSWLGTVGNYSIQGIFEEIPALHELADENEIIERYYTAEVNQKKELQNPLGMAAPAEKYSKIEAMFGPRLAAVFPELVQVQSALADYLTAIADKIVKAELWLSAQAIELSTFASLEAAVYLTSRQKQTIAATQVEQMWYEKICYEITRNNYQRVDASTLAKVEAGQLPLDQLASLHSVGHEVVRFWVHNRYDYLFKNATMLRAADWLNINGFERWWEAAVGELSTGPRSAVDPMESPQQLFYWCRCDRALQLADKRGLNAWVLAIEYGEQERTKPWLIWKNSEERPVTQECLLLAGAVAFVLRRLLPAPEAKTNTTLNGAINTLLRNQLRGGGWPFWQGDTEADVLTTCLAVHALSVATPEGWQAEAQKAAVWLLAQQLEIGCWAERGIHTVMLTVLALDTIAIANQETKLTFHTDSSVLIKNQSHPAYDCSREAWYNPQLPYYPSRAFESLGNLAPLEVLLVVATVTELKQVLRVLNPLDGESSPFRVPYNQETYYLGLFGAHRAVIVKSSMGDAGPGGATLATNAAIDLWNPLAVIMPGIAFGARRDKYGAADILLATSIIPYEPQRVGTEVQFRSPIPPTSATLVNRFEHAFDWRFVRPDGTLVEKHVGSLLSGAKLVDNTPFKNFLLNQFPTAIGGEMEGAGIWAASDRHSVAWIIVKAVCDWADGVKDDSLQEMAAASSVSICQHILFDPLALHGLRRPK